jgi:TolA-binding protein
MIRQGWVLLAFFCLAAVCFGQSKEFIQLNRELLNLEDKVATAQRSTDEKLERILQMVQKLADSYGGAMAELSGSLRQQLQDQQKAAATTGVKVDQMAAEFQALKESVAAVNARFARLEQQIADIRTALATLQAPPAPPTPTAPSGLSAEALFQNALRDKNGGNDQLALRQFEDYLAAFGSTERAGAAQYYIGEIYFNAGEWQKAVDAFDLVLEKFPDNEKTPDAHYMKALALRRLGKTAAARDELNALIKRFPGNRELVERARAQLKELSTAKPAAKK